MRGLPVSFPYVALPAIDVQASRRLSWLQLNSFISPTKKPDAAAGLFQQKNINLLLSSASLRLIRSGLIASQPERLISAWRHWRCSH